MNINKLLSSDTVLSLAGKWIWTGGELATDVYARFRGAFTVDAPPSEAVMTIANTCGEYELWVNGRRAGRGGTPSTPEVHFADTHVITEFLRPGENVVAILAHAYGTGGQWWSFSPAGLIAEVRAGEEVLAASGPDWKASLAPEFSRRAHRLLMILGFAEVVDLRKEEENWIAPDFDDTSWHAADLCRELGEHAVIPRETALPITTSFAASPTGSGRWLCPEGVQTIPLAAAVAEHGPGTYRITSYTMSPGVDTALEVMGDGDYVVSVNGAEVARHYFRRPLGNTYTEQNYFETHEYREQQPRHLRLEPGWNEVCIEAAADERTSGVWLRFMGTSFMKTTMPFFFSAAKRLDEPGWKIEKIGGVSAAVSAQPDLPPAEVLSSWNISIPDLDTSPPGKNVTIEPGRYAIFDLGRVMSGRPVIDVTAPGGSVIDLQYAEWISDYDKVLQAAGMKCVDRVICREGRQQRENVARRGLRYVKVFNSGGGPAIVHNVSLKVEKVVGDPEGGFECSDPLLNRIHKACVDTLDVSLNYHLVDCPTRENGQYPGDNYVQVQQMFYLYGDLRISRKGIRQFPRVQEENGFFPGMTPAEWRHSLTDYSLIWVSWIADHYRHTADTALVREMLPYIEKLFGFFRSIKDSEHGLPRRTSAEHYWLFLDHSPIDRRGLVCGYAAWYARALADAAWMAGEVGKGELSTKWGDEADAVRAAARELFWDEAAGLYRDCFSEGELSPSITLQTNVIALFTDLATGEQLNTMPGKMWRPDGAKIQPELRVMNPYFQHYVLEALAKTGKFEWGLKHIRDYWGLMLACGAKSNWECFQSTAPIVPTASQCHPWSGSPAYWLPARVLGVRAAAPGWAKAVVRPQATDGIDWARGAVPTPHGLIKVEWRRKGQEIDLKCEAPQGVEIVR